MSLPMTDDWKAPFDEITRGAQAIKESCLNRHDEKFAPWHERARKILVQYAPKKLPTFDEIRFASDYFLSKNREEQEDIDDRIALISDIDLFQKITTTLVHDLRKKNRHFVKLEEIIHEDSKLQADREPTQVKWESTPNTLKQSRELVMKLSLPRRDAEEALQEIDRVEREFGKTHPDWDLIKRSIKFFLDFDRLLAQEIIPLILSLLPKR